jgi:predicted methyltransferase
VNNAHRSPPLASVLLLSLVAGCATPSAGPSPASQPSTAATARAAEIVAAPDRVQRDKDRDAARKPVEMLAFFGVEPGMHVAEVGAGGGYSTELFARAVGPTGVVVAQDTPDWDGPGLKKAWEDRLSHPPMKNTTHVMLPWEQPLPAEAHDLDAVYSVAVYHDVIVENKDPAKMNAAIFAALKSGGVYAIIDNSARAGSGVADCPKLHRIDEATLRDQVTRAGFVLRAEGSFLRNPADPRDWNADPDAKLPQSHTQDRFALKFVKP